MSINTYLTLLFEGIQSDVDQQLLDEKWEVLCQMTQGAFVFDKSGCLTYTELHTFLKVGLYIRFTVDCTQPGT